MRVAREAINMSEVKKTETEDANCVDSGIFSGTGSLNNANEHIDTEAIEQEKIAEKEELVGDLSVGLHSMNIKKEVAKEESRRVPEDWEIPYVQDDEGDT